MYRLASPQWHDLPVEGARIQMRPITSRMWLGALARLKDERTPETDFALTLDLAQQTICGFEGIGDANGEPAVVAPHTIEALLDDPRMFLAVQGIVQSALTLQEAEKND